MHAVSVQLLGVGLLLLHFKCTPFPSAEQKYWAKDLIFLITEQEQLGMQAWLEAYHGTSGADDGHTTGASILQAGSLEARSGSIQAAINLELPAFELDFLDVKIEGLNGQLPNLDLVNVVQRIALKEGIVSGHQQRTRRRRNGAKSTHRQNFGHMVAMVLQQAAGVPNGNHGLFHRYGVAALTLEGHRGGEGGAAAATTAQRETVGAAALLKLVEGVARSVNNLLERFHQSFFFYLLVASDRFVSIGDYMPALAAMVAALLVKALIVWLSLGEPDNSIASPAKGQLDGEHPTSEQQEQALRQPDAIDDAQPTDDRQLLTVGKLLLLVHAFGLLASYLPQLGPLNRYAFELGWRTEQFQFGLMAAVCAGAALAPLVFRLGAGARPVLHVVVLLELATVLLIVGMLNFAFAFTLATCIVPAVLLVRPTDGRRQPHWRVGVSGSRMLCAALNPLAMAYAAVLAVTVFSFPELSVCAWADRALAATAEAITFAVVDSMIYGNWVFNVVMQILLPIWICLWTVTFSAADRLNHTAPAPASVKSTVK